MSGTDSNNDNTNNEDEEGRPGPSQRIILPNTTLIATSNKSGRSSSTSRITTITTTTTNMTIPSRDTTSITANNPADGDAAVTSALPPRSQIPRFHPPNKRHKAESTMLSNHQQSTNESTPQSHCGLCTSRTSSLSSSNSGTTTSGSTSRNAAGDASDPKDHVQLPNDRPQQNHADDDDDNNGSYSGGSSGDDAHDDDDAGASTPQQPQDDSNEEDDDDIAEGEEDDVDDLDPSEVVALQQFLAATRGRIPLEFLAQLQRLQQLDGGGDRIQQQQQEPLPYIPPQSLSDVARFIQSDACQNIIILAGAGMSVASGIPDFRSPNGLYATLQADQLTCDNETQLDRIQADPSYALDQHLFLENPLPCLEVNREFVLGIHEQRWKATLAHRFVELLHAKTGKLCRLYTQNIDGLEDQCHLLPHSKRIAVHGSMDEACCAKCNAIMPMDQFCHELRTKIKDWTKGIRSKDDDDDKASSSSSATTATTVVAAGPPAPVTSSPIYCGSCGAPAVKPNIVLFRSPLPPQFFEYSMEDTPSADLLLILGTSLGVAPANSLMWRVPPRCMRVVLNRELVGWHLGFDPHRNDRDLFARGNCENLCLELCKELGWLSNLRPLVEDEGNCHLPDSSRDLLLAALEHADDRNDEGSGTETVEPSDNATNI